MQLFDLYVEVTYLHFAKFRRRGAVPFYFGLAGTLHGTQVSQNTINKYYFNQNFKLGEIVNWLYMESTYKSNR
jgi:hypothetical protein